MNENYIEVKIPILDNVEEMEIVKTFDEQQLWFVCAIAKAFENSEQENTKLKQGLYEIKEIIDACKKLMQHEFDWEEQADNILQIIEKIGGSKE